MHLGHDSLSRIAQGIDPYTSANNLVLLTLIWTMLHDFSILLELVAYKSGYKESFNRTVCM